MSALSPLDANSHAVSEERQDVPRSPLGKRKAILPLRQKPRGRPSKKRRGPLARKKAGIAKALSRKSAGPRPPKEVSWRVMRRICVASTHNCTFIVPDSRPDPQKSKLTDWSAGSPREALERAIAEWNSFDTARRPSLRGFCRGIGTSTRTFRGALGSGIGKIGRPRVLLPDKSAYGLVIDFIRARDRCVWHAQAA